MIFPSRNSDVPHWGMAVMQLKQREIVPGQSVACAFTAERHQPLPAGHLAPFVRIPGCNEILLETKPHHTVLSAGERRVRNTQGITILNIVQIHTMANADALRRIPVSTGLPSTRSSPAAHLPEGLKLRVLSLEFLRAN